MATTPSLSPMGTAGSDLKESREYKVLPILLMPDFTWRVVNTNSTIKGGMTGLKTIKKTAKQYRGVMIEDNKTKVLHREYKRFFVNGLRPYPIKFITDLGDAYKLHAIARGDATMTQPMILYLEMTRQLRTDPEFFMNRNLLD